MNKVTTINLNGRAYQVEEKGYEALHHYLENAAKTLADNPDKDEILQDIEQAVADKCEDYLQDGKNVVTAAEADTILAAIGPVDGQAADAGAPMGGQTAQRPRRLYTVPQGAMVAGVCNGIAAYFGLDVTFVRIAFVALTFITGGFWIGLYIVLAIVLPQAKTEEQLAEAYGKPGTAREIIDRAREQATDPETLRAISTNVTRIWRIFAKLISVVAGIVLGIISVAWIMALWGVVLGHFNFHGSLAHLNGWREWLAVTALYVLVAMPLLLLSRIFGRIGDDKSISRRTAIGEGALAVLWGAAFITALGLATAYGQQLYDYSKAHKGYIDIGNSSICVDAQRCHPGDGHYFYRTTVPPVAPVNP